MLKNIIEVKILEFSLLAKNINILHVALAISQLIEKDCWHSRKPICHYCKKPSHMEKNCRNTNKHQVNFAEEHN